jgi:hypothetical protein
MPVKVLKKEQYKPMRLEFGPIVRGPAQVLTTLWPNENQILQWKIEWKWRARPQIGVLIMLNGI